MLTFLVDSFIGVHKSSEQLGMSTCKPNQKIGQDNFALRVKTALLREQRTITALAKRLGLSRNGVSRAINHPVLPTVRRRIKQELGL